MRWFATLLVVGLAAATASAQPQAPPAPPPTLTREASVTPQAQAGTERSLRLPRSPVPPAITPGPVGTWRERAEDTAEVVVQLTGSHPVVQSAVLVEGVSAFHLANPDWTDESVQLGPVIRPASGTFLFFESRLGYATSTQVAKAQISTNNGATWTTLWSRAGSDGPPQGGFELVSLPLGSYAGQDLRIRFLFDYTGGSAYTGFSTNPPVGWFVDDIQVGTAFIPRLFANTGDPNPDEILLLEFVNRARADAVAEAARLRATMDPDILSAVNYFGVDFNLMETQFATLVRHLPPLAMNGKLLTAARLHTQDMLANAFQGHVSSSSPPPPNQPGDTVSMRVDRQGYAWSLLGENAFSYAKNPWHAHAGFNIDWGGGAGGMQSPPGHRLSIHNGAFREAGIGAIYGTNTVGGNKVGPFLVTQDFAATPGGGQALITGVTHRDVDGDAFYDPGEGLGGVVITVDGTSSYTLSSTHGAYAVPVAADGTYTVRFSHPAFLPVQRTITIAGTNNVKADFRAQSVAMESVQRLNASTLRTVVRSTLPTNALTMQLSTNGTTWSPASAATTSLGGDRWQMDVTVPPGALRALVRVRADWVQP